MRELARVEIEELKVTRDKLFEDMRNLLLPKDPNDAKDVILEIRGGTGGEEAALFAADLFRMYSRFAEIQRWKVEVLSATESQSGGFKEIVCQIQGKSVYSHLKYESGVCTACSACPKPRHRAASTPRPPPWRFWLKPRNRISTSAPKTCASTCTAPAARAASTSTPPTPRCASRTSRPAWVVACQDERSQIKNRARAMKILRSRPLGRRGRERQDKERAASRKTQVGSGDRSERIRTYNFPQGRLTDHRINYTVYRLPEIMEGDMEELVVQMRTFFQAEALRGDDN